MRNLISASVLLLDLIKTANDTASSDKDKLERYKALKGTVLRGRDPFDQDEVFLIESLEDIYAVAFFMLHDSMKGNVSVGLAQLETETRAPIKVFQDIFLNEIPNVLQSISGITTHARKLEYSTLNNNGLGEDYAPLVRSVPFRDGLVTSGFFKNPSNDVAWSDNAANMKYARFLICNAVDSNKSVRKVIEIFGDFIDKINFSSDEDRRSFANVLLECKKALKTVEFAKEPNALMRGGLLKKIYIPTAPYRGDDGTFDYQVATPIPSEIYTLESSNRIKESVNSAYSRGGLTRAIPKTLARFIGGLGGAQPQNVGFVANEVGGAQKAFNSAPYLPRRADGDLKTAYAMLKSGSPILRKDLGRDTFVGKLADSYVKLFASVEQSGYENMNIRNSLDNLRRMLIEEIGELFISGYQTVANQEFSDEESQKLVSEFILKLDNGAFVRESIEVAYLYALNESSKRTKVRKIFGDETLNSASEFIETFIRKAI